MHQKTISTKGVRKNLSTFFTIALIFLMTLAIIPSVMGVMGTQPVDLGSACNFAILSKSGISTTGTTHILGNIGVSPIAATGITGFGLTMDSSNQFSTSSHVNGKVYAANYAAPTPSMMTTAISNMQTAYTDANGRAAGVTELGAGNIGGMTLAPGVYKWSTGVTIPKDVTLSGNSNDVWIFQVAQTLGIYSATKVILSGDAQAKNVYWVVGGKTTLGAGSVFNGNILDKTAIVLGTGATLNGRALAQTAVTLQANTVNGPTTCSVTAPQVNSISPTSGSISGGTPVTISGSGFAGASEVDFGPYPASILTVSDTTITVTSPGQLSSGIVDVRVIGPHGTSAFVPADQFTYGGGPVITGLSPTTGTRAGGTSVTISGSGFAGASEVDFGPYPASILTVSDTTITVTSSGHLSSGIVDVRVIGPHGTSAIVPADHFTYV
jgi:hypothetical protein